MGRKGEPICRRVTQHYGGSQKVQEPPVNPARNKHCEKCKYSNKREDWNKAGTCNFLSITGVPRIRFYKAKDCPGFPGRRLKGKKERIEKELI